MERYKVMKQSLEDTFAEIYLSEENSARAFDHEETRAAGESDGGGIKLTAMEKDVQWLAQRVLFLSQNHTSTTMCAPCIEGNAT